MKAKAFVIVNGDGEIAYNSDDYGDSYIQIFWSKEEAYRILNAHYPTCTIKEIGVF